MNCHYHPDREAVGSCANCKRPVCVECATIEGERWYCPKCYALFTAPITAQSTRTAPLRRAHQESVSEDMKLFCMDCIARLGTMLNTAILLGYEDEEGLNMAMDIMIETKLETKIVDRKRIVQQAHHYADVAGTPYDRLSPLNQFIVTIPPYVYHCFDNHLPSEGSLKAEAEQLMNTRGFPRYLQETLGYPASQKIGGAFFKPS